MNAVTNVRPRGLNVVPVKIDLEGMRPDGPGGLEDVLANWDESKGKRPHLVYTVTYVDFHLLSLQILTQATESAKIQPVEHSQFNAEKIFMQSSVNTMS